MTSKIEAAVELINSAIKLAKITGDHPTIFGEVEIQEDRNQAMIGWLDKAKRTLAISDADWQEMMDRTAAEVDQRTTRRLDDMRASYTTQNQTEVGEMEIREGWIEYFDRGERRKIVYRSTLPYQVNHHTGYQISWPALYGMPSDFYISADECDEAPLLGIHHKTRVACPLGFVVNPKYWSERLREAYRRLEEARQIIATARRAWGDVPLYARDESRRIENPAVAEAYEAITDIVIELGKTE